MLAAGAENLLVTSFIAAQRAPASAYSPSRPAPCSMGVLSTLVPATAQRRCRTPSTRKRASGATAPKKDVADDPPEPPIGASARAARRPPRRSRPSPHRVKGTGRPAHAQAEEPDVEYKVSDKKPAKKPSTKKPAAKKPAAKTKKEEPTTYASSRRKQ